MCVCVCARARARARACVRALWPMISWNLTSHACETKFLMAILHWKQGFSCDKDASISATLHFDVYICLVSEKSINIPPLWRRGGWWSSCSKVNVAEKFRYFFLMDRYILRRKCWFQHFLVPLPLILDKSTVGLFGRKVNSIGEQSLQGCCSVLLDSNDDIYLLRILSKLCQDYRGWWQTRGRWNCLIN